MRLELKHLAPYLPYGLEFIYTDTNKRGCIRSLYEIEEYEDIKLSINRMDGEHIWMFKPILRPLSDLTKEIEVNGEKFVPLNEIYKINSKVSIYKLTNHNLEITFDTEDFMQEIDLYEGYLIMQKLLELHFDVFGLIEQGLAIDINTL